MATRRCVTLPGARRSSRPAVGRVAGPMSPQRPWTPPSTLPPLYAGWIGDLLGGPIARESQATCENCAMLPEAGEHQPSELFFNAETKCGAGMRPSTTSCALSDTHSSAWTDDSPRAMWIIHTTAPGRTGDHCLPSTTMDIEYGHAPKRLSAIDPRDAPWHPRGMSIVTSLEVMKTPRRIRLC